MMSDLHPAIPRMTSLFRLKAMNLSDSMNYRIIAQSESEVRDIQNAPAISMSYFITESEQTKLLRTVSIYSQRGETSDQVRLLYMNDAAFRSGKLWEGANGYRCTTSATIDGPAHVWHSIQ